ncbi:PhzF family phenazine biosynthesis protein [Kribbella deserti]|uniref:PhzF family phenazine biosynthesis protein n=1 Tax=Kribbella deserti TaxID=1926257 RepID=A0ABV6QJL0_9ACTN
MRIRVVDAFTSTPFSGNPAGVCVLEVGDWPDDAWMSAVAREMAHAETAFTKPGGPDDDGIWGLRWFTPAIEENLCGHATLATTHALYSDGAIGPTVRFSSRSGILAATVNDDGSITLDFPKAEVTPMEVPAGLAEALGVEVVGAYGTGVLRDVLIEVADETTVRGVVPDLGRVEAIQHRDTIRGVTVTALASSGADYDFVSRFFSPNDGIPEDPVTGSAHTALAPFWADRLGRGELRGWQASARGGLVHVVPEGDRVKLSGRAVTMLDGTLHSEPAY